MRQYIDLITEASYDSMIATLKTAYPDLTQYITDQVRWAKAALKRDDRITWYLRIIKAYVALNKTGKDTLTPLLGYPALDFGDTDVESIQHQVTHYFGFNIPEIEQLRFNRQTVEQLLGDFSNIYDEWELKQSATAKEQVPMQSGDYELIKFPNGSAWIFVNRAYCEREGASGKHCGNVVGQHKKDQRILSYRVDGRVLMTFILEEDGFLGEMKAKGNQKPAEKLHPYIVELLLNPIVKGIKGGGYLPESNFSLFDLNEQLFTRVQKARPEFVKQQIAADPAGVVRAPKSLFNDPENISVAYEKLPGLDLVMNTSGQMTTDPTAWSRAMRLNPMLAFHAPPAHPERLIGVKEILELHPSELLNAPADIRNNPDTLFEIGKINPRIVTYIVPTTPGYDQLIIRLTKSNGWVLHYLPKNSITPEMIQAGLESPNAERVAEELHTFPNLTAEAVDQAVSFYSSAVMELPEHLYTNDNVARWIKINPESLKSLPSRYQTQEMYEQMLKHSPFEFRRIPERFKNYQTMMIVADRIPILMRAAFSRVEQGQLSHEEYRSLAARAVLSTQTPALKYINPFFITFELAKTAVKHNPDNLEYIKNSEMHDRVRSALHIDDKPDTQLPENFLRTLIDLTSK